MIRKRISVVEGDITTLNVDAIVNAANETLLGGGGVDGAIHRAAGPGLMKECHTLGGCEIGKAKVTRGHSLQAKYVIHTVGPVWHGGKEREEDILAQCYRSSLALAKNRDVRTIAFPAISTGAYGFPIDRASKIAVREVISYLKLNAVPVKVTFVCFDNANFRAITQALNSIEL